IWTLLVILSGYTMFEVKATVGRLDHHLAGINHEIAADREQIHALNVEWAMLTQPQRLQLLSQEVLQLAPISTQVLGSFDEVPLREGIAAAPTPAGQDPATPEAKQGKPVAQLAEVSARTRP
ncbi:MAG: cell division protein FtsL, partial [Stellaceae bacterium]